MVYTLLQDPIRRQCAYRLGIGGGACGSSKVVAGDWNPEDHGQPLGPAAGAARRAPLVWPYGRLFEYEGLLEHGKRLHGLGVHHG